MSLWEFLDEKLEKNDCNIWNQHPRACQNAKKCAKQNKKKQRNKQTKTGPKMPYLAILDCRFEKVLSYFQQPRICQNEKFRAKLKILNFVT